MATPGSGTERPTLIFLHILKTGGTTLNRLLGHYFDLDRSFATFPTEHHPNGSLAAFRALTPAAKVKIDWLTGHMGYGLHRELPRPAEYITLLRDPVERVISRYYHEKRHAKSLLHAEINAGMGLADYAQHRARLAGSDNLQTRMLSGNWQQRGIGVCDEAMLVQAQENLARHAVVGLTGQFDAFYLLLTRRYGWRAMAYQRTNVTRGRPAAATFAAETLAVVRRLNAYDARLYAYAAARLAADIEAEGVAFRAALARYRAWNWAANLFWRLTSLDKKRG